MSGAFTALFLLPIRQLNVDSLVEPMLFLLPEYRKSQCLTPICHRLRYQEEDLQLERRPSQF
jgi:hypothetical protein